MAFAIEFTSSFVVSCLLALGPFSSNVDVHTFTCLRCARDGPENEKTQFHHQFGFWMKSKSDTATVASTLIPKRSSKVNEIRLSLDCCRCCGGHLHIYVAPKHETKYEQRNSNKVCRCIFSRNFLRFFFFLSSLAACQQCRRVVMRTYQCIQTICSCYCSNTYFHSKTWHLSLSSYLHLKGRHQRLCTATTTTATMVH